MQVTLTQETTTDVEQMTQGNRLDQLCINTIRMLAVDAVEKARSGHPGMPMEASDIGYILWTRFLKHNPANPNWPNRDRFVLSAGHGSMFLYALLHLTGYDVSLEDLRQFRQWDSITPGHPEYGHTPGRGPQGQSAAGDRGHLETRHPAGLRGGCREAEQSVIRHERAANGSERNQKTMYHFSSMKVR